MSCACGALSCGVPPSPCSGPPRTDCKIKSHPPFIAGVACPPQTPHGHPRIFLLFRRSVYPLECFCAPFLVSISSLGLPAPHLRVGGGGGLCPTAVLFCTTNVGPPEGRFTHTPNRSQVREGPPSFLLRAPLSLPLLLPRSFPPTNPILTPPTPLPPDFARRRLVRAPLQDGQALRTHQDYARRRAGARCR